MTRRAVLNLFVGNRAASLLYRYSLRPLHTSVSNTSSQPRAGFRPEKVAVVTKTTRYEFEQQRYRFAGLSEEDLKQLVRILSVVVSLLVIQSSRPNKSIVPLIFAACNERLQLQWPTGKTQYSQ